MDGEAFFYGAVQGGEEKGQKSTGRGRAGKGSKSAGRGTYCEYQLIEIICYTTAKEILIPVAL